MKLISVSGCGHAGTTLMATILGAHPSLYLYPYETWAFVEDRVDVLDSLLNNKYDDNIKYVVEKTPKHIHFVDKISERYKDTKFIFMVRDPRDIVASLYKRTSDWHESINRVYHDLYSVRIYRHDGIVVKYEDLVNDFDNTVLDVCNHIGIDYVDSMKDFYKSAPNWYGVSDPVITDGVGENHEIRRAWQVKQPLFNGSGRWKNELNKDQQLEVYQVLGGLASDFGYDILCI